MKINKKNPRHWYYLALQAFFTWVAIALRPLLRKPPSHIVILYGHQFAGHLGAIYDHWDGTGPSDLECHFLSLDPDPVLADRSADVNILYCHRIRDMLTVARASAMITDHGLHMMVPLVHFTNLKFIDVGHGIPFKGYDEQDFRLQRHYSEIWTSSEGLSDLYAWKCHCEGLVYSLGAPRTDKFVNASNQGHPFRTFAGISPETPIILYAPTWQQDDRGRALVPFGQNEEGFLKALSNFCKESGAVLVFRSHQNAVFPELPYERIIFCPQSEYPDTEELLLATDFLISDWSSIVFDFMVLDRPTIFLDVPPPFAKGCTLGAEYRFGHIVGNMNELMTALGTYVQDPDDYMNEYGGKHRDVKAFAYDDNADGHTSERCISRMQELLA